MLSFVDQINCVFIPGNLQQKGGLVLHVISKKAKERMGSKCPNHNGL